VEGAISLQIPPRCCPGIDSADYRAGLSITGNASDREEMSKKVMAPHLSIEWPAN
jgi:hypothetical protein